MRTLLDLVSFSNYIQYGIAGFAVVLLLAILCFKRNPFISLLFAIVGFFVATYVVYIPNPLLNSIVSGYNRQIMYTNNPEKQKILHIDKIVKNQIHYSIHNQDKFCLIKDVKKVKQGILFYGIWNSLSKIRYNEKVIKPGHCSTLISKQIENCDNISINKCLDNFYHKYYF